MLSPLGRAVSEAVPALYAALEPYENDGMDPRQRILHSPLGAVLGALQLTSKVSNDLLNAEQIFGVERAQGLKSACATDGCKFRGRHFTIVGPGVIDTVTDARRFSRKGRSCGNPGWTRLSLAGFFSPKNGDGLCTERGGCFGMCGWDCYFPPEDLLAIYTPECEAHDL